MGEHGLTKRWLLGGVACGALVVGSLAPVILLADARLNGTSSSDDLGVAVGASIIGVGWGAVGGFAAGGICAALASTGVKRRGPSGNVAYARLAAVVTAVLATPAALALIIGDRPGPSDLLVWFILPVGVSALTAYAMGGRIWTQQRASTGAS